LNLLTNITNNLHPKPELSTPCEAGVINESDIVEINLIVVQFNLQLSCKHRTNFVTWAYYMVVNLLWCPDLVVISIEVAIENDNLDIGNGKNLRETAALLTAWNHPNLDSIPIWCPDLPPCKDFVT
jgi:hypothetical protein